MLSLTLDLEPQAIAFSFKEDGVIKYLTLLPQRNRVGDVTDREGGPTEIDAVQKFSELDPQNIDGNYIPRCWIHTHPCFKAFMSSTDIYQLHGFACQYRHSFGIVISPRGEGLKALTVHLTEDGFEETGRYCNEAEVRGTNAKEYVTTRIHSSTKKFYCQIPFSTSSETCQVVDLRGKDDVISQLTESLASGDSEHYW